MASSPAAYGEYVTELWSVSTPPVRSPWVMCFIAADVLSSHPFPDERLQ